MALVYFDGFQDAQTTRKPEWIGGAVFNFATGRDGSTNGAAGGPGGTVYLPFTLGSSTMIMGFGLNVNNVWGSTITWMSWSNGSTPTYLLHMGVDGSGRLYFMRGANLASGTLVGTSSGHDPIVQSRWYHLQIKYVAHVSAGTLIVRLDGFTVLNLTGVQTANNTLTPDRWYFNTFNNWGGNFVTVDDFWIADDTNGTSTQGRANNDFLGDLGVKSLIPTTDGDVGSWAKSTGTNGAALVDEVPPNTTDYVFSNIPAQQQLFQIQDLPSTTGPVYGVRLNHYSLKSDAGASSVKPLLKENSVVTSQAANPLSTTAAAFGGPFLWTKPSAPTTPWSAADVNALQVGVELA